MNRKLTAKSSLDSIKKEAKRWLKAVRAGESDAVTRLKQTLHRADVDIGLREIQQALAREYGFESWAALKVHLDDEVLARRTHEERVAEFLEHAILNYGIPPQGAAWNPNYPDDPARRDYAARILAKHPEIVRGNLYAAVVAADLEEVTRILAQDSHRASRKGGPRSWEPLLYLAYGRLPIASVAENSVAIATLLLSHGADPNVQMTDGENPFTAITGFIGEGERTPTQVPAHPNAEALVRMLIAHGANAFDTQALYNTSLWRDNTDWLELLYSYDERAGQTARWNAAAAGQLGQLDYLLTNAVSRDHVRRVEWLLAHGANPRVKHAYSKRNLHTVAQLHGHTRSAMLLARAGAEIEKLQGAEAFQAACLSMDAERVRELARLHPEYLANGAALLVAARSGRCDVLELLLDLGASANVESSNGERALHLAVWSDSVPVARLLIDRGAEVDARDRKFDATPLGWAIHLGKPQLAEFLSSVSSDIFSLASAGKLERLRTVLEAQPALARTVRNDRTALFFQHAANEDRAIEIAQLFLKHGADPSFVTREGTTASAQAERNGLDALAQVLDDARS